MQKLAHISKGRKVLAILLGIVLLLLALVISLRVAYRGRIYPGVTVNGVYLGGLTAAEATRELNTQTEKYMSKQVEVMTPQGTQQLTATQLGVQFDNATAVQKAVAVGRDGWLLDKVGSQVSSLIGQNPPISTVTYSVAPLSDSLVAINTATAKPVQNATFVSQNNTITIADSNRGKRVDFARAPQAISDHFGQLQTKLFVLPTLTVEPQLTSQSLESQKNIILPYEKSPLVLSYGAKNWAIDANTLVSWLTTPGANQPAISSSYTKYYELPSAVSSTLSFDKKAVVDYVTTLSEQVNVTPVDAQLTITNGKATVFNQSRDGKLLDITTTSNAILDQLSKATTTPIALTVTTTKAEVSDANLDNLGIKELISEGMTYFPNSPPNRMHNIRLGTSKFNGVLVKPGQVFSFDDNLGEVSTASGYTEGLVILGDHEEKQAGGGLCQVSSTAYRAALLAGLPILARTNHAFAVDYYTAPYGVPGVDATIYLPGVDMKFLNDTGHYILIQTELVGTTLKFRFYGTKVKSGVIRGPQFVSGSLNAAVPSHTVFYRDVVDLNGKVTKTDEINTYYKSSLDFPITD